MDASLALGKWAETMEGENPALHVEIDPYMPEKDGSQKYEVIIRYRFCDANGPCLTEIMYGETI